MASAADGAGGDMATKLCLMQRHTQLCPKYGKEGVKTCYYATSYQPFDNSQGNQEERGQPDCGTASPSSPSWQDPGTEIVPGRGGVGNHGVRESSLPTAISTGFEGEHGTTRQHSPSSEGQLGHWVPVGCGGAGLPADPWRGKVA